MENEPGRESFNDPRDVPQMPYAVQRKAEHGLIPLSEDAWKKEFTEGRLQELMHELEDRSRQLPQQSSISALTDVCRTLKKALEHQVNMLVVSKSEARQLVFPIGHPRYRVLYVGHPANSKFYVPMANFHRLIFEQKVAEAQHLLVALGATNIEVEHYSGAHSAIEGGISVTEVGGFKGGKSTEQQRRVSSKMKMHPHAEPEIPKDLVWYEHEPLWQEVARARLSAGLESFELDIHYTDDFGVNAKLSAKVEKIGIEVGGSFSRHEQETWRLRGSFGKVQSGLEATSDSVVSEAAVGELPG
jgi:hypothetical protein